MTAWEPPCHEGNFPCRHPPNDARQRLPCSTKGRSDFDDSRGPSLPIILISAAAGIAGGVIGLYITYIVLGWELPAGVFVAVLCASAGLGVSGAGLTALTGARAATANIAMSCALILISVVFLSLCMLSGAIVATLLVLFGG